MEIPVKMLEVLTYEGVVAIASQGDTTPHLVNTWNSYIEVSEKKSLLIPAGGMKVTEENVKKNNVVYITLGSRKVDGFHSKGTGFYIVARAEFLYKGDAYNSMKQKFPWLRAVLELQPTTITQTL